MVERERGGGGGGGDMILNLWTRGWYSAPESFSLRKRYLFQQNCFRLIEEPFREASMEVSDFENSPSKENICRLNKLSKHHFKTLISKENTCTRLYIQVTYTSPG